MSKRIFNFTDDMLDDLEQFLSIYYYKILRVDYEADTYEIVLSNSTEKAPTSEYFSKWLSDFIEAGGVAPEDKELFKANTNIEKLRKLKDEEHHFIYRKLVGDKYYNAAFISLPASDSGKNFVFIKEIELAD